MKINTQKKCLVPFCNKTQIYSRGLCLCHYQYIGKLVRGKKITWEMLEKQGKVLPKAQTRFSKLKDWLLSK